jgi:hypothetical protein
VMDTHTRRWIEPPLATRDIDCQTFADALRSQPDVTQAWLAGDIQQLQDGSERTRLGMALVLLEPSGASERPEMIELIGRLDTAASGLGLRIQTWAFVSSITIDREISLCGLRVYSSKPWRTRDDPPRD